MKTKFILHGGFNRDKPRPEEDVDTFYAEILKDAPKESTILLVCFARDIEKVPAATAKVMSAFERVQRQRKLHFEIAREDTFEEQVVSADIIYLHGGTTLKLITALKKFPNLKELFKGKIIAGESAGANVLGRFCYSPHANDVIECLGILSLKIIPHFCEEYRDKVDGVGNGLETLLLPEYEFKVFTVEQN